jgi:hypothetical protein
MRNEVKKRRECARGRFLYPFAKTDPKQIIAVSEHAIVCKYDVTLTMTTGVGRRNELVGGDGSMS